MSNLTDKKTKEVIIELDNTLEQENLYSLALSKHYSYVEGWDKKADEEKIEAFKQKKIEEFNAQIIKQSTSSNLVTVRDCIYGEHRHLGYLEYLGFAWKKHIGVVFTPDFFWQIFLTEVASYIKNNAETHRDLFTDSDEKKEIVVITEDPQLIDLRLISDELLKLTPTNTKIFLPEFTTTTFEASMAFKAAFADSMSPYYNYSMMLCGIPRVKVLGEESDWDKVISNIESFGEILAIPEYFDKVKSLAGKIKENISNPDKEFWKDIFSLDKCGSGGQVEVKGWINDLFMKLPRPGYIQNYPSSTSYVKYKFLNTGQDFELCYGLFSSELKDGYLLPEFGYIINEIK